METTNRESLELLATAHHEAAHAVFAQRYRVRFHSLTVVPSERYFGKLTLLLPDLGGGPLASIQNRGKWVNDLNMRQDVEGAIMTVLAGSLAGEHFCHLNEVDDDPYGGVEDMAQASQLAEAVFGEGMAAEKYVEWLTYRALDEMFFPLYSAWPAITALAYKLVESRRIGYKRAIGIIQEAEKQGRAAELDRFNRNRKEDEGAE